MGPEVGREQPRSDGRAQQWVALNSSQDRDEIVVGALERLRELQNLRRYAALRRSLMITDRLQRLHQRRFEQRAFASEVVVDARL